MAEFKFPRTLSKGLLAGQTFQTYKEYVTALRAHPDYVPKKVSGRKLIPANGSTDNCFRLELTKNGIHTIVEGPIRGDAVDTLLDAVAQASR